MEVVVTTGAVSHAKLQSNHHHQQTIILFLQAGCPSCHPTNSVKALKGKKYHILWTCLPQAHMGVFQLCLWPLIAPGYLGGGLPCLSSALWCQYPSCSRVYWFRINYMVPPYLTYVSALPGDLKKRVKFEAFSHHSITTGLHNHTTAGISVNEAHCHHQPVLSNNNKLCGRPPQYAPTPASWPLTFWPWKRCPSNVWCGLPLC